jgi:chromate reductase
MANTALILVGSLRKQAFSLKLANALARLSPESLKLEVVTLHDLGLFDGDLEATPPDEWLAFRNRIKASDGVLIVTPEYNRSIPGVLKNAIDIASRPYAQSAFNGRPVGLIGNSPGALGAVSAVKHLQQIMPGICGPIMQQPEIYLTGIGDAFDDTGELTKQPVKDLLVSYLKAFAAHVAAHKK